MRLAAKGAKLQASGDLLACLTSKEGNSLVQGVYHVMKRNHITSCGCFINLPHYARLSITDREAIHFGLCPKINMTFSITFIKVWNERKNALPVKKQC